jgi:hypothetical protein
LDTLNQSQSIKTSPPHTFSLHCAILNVNHSLNTFRCRVVVLAFAVALLSAAAALAVFTDDTLYRSCTCGVPSPMHLRCRRSRYLAADAACHPSTRGLPSLMHFRRCFSASATRVFRLRYFWLSACHNNLNIRHSLCLFIAVAFT